MFEEEARYPYVLQKKLNKMKNNEGQIVEEEHIFFCSIILHQTEDELVGLYNKEKKQGVEVLVLHCPLTNTMSSRACEHKKIGSSQRRLGLNFYPKDER